MAAVGCDLVVAGVFTHYGTSSLLRIARGHPGAWQPLGGGIGTAAGGSVVYALAALTNGDIVAGGLFTTAGGTSVSHIARGDGNTWVAQSTPTAAWDDDVLALVALPNGDYVGGGDVSFFGLGGIFGGSNANLARHLRGTGSLIRQAFDLLGACLAGLAGATLQTDGDLVVVGDFEAAGGLVNHSVAVLRPTCPASALTVGSGCAGSGGPNVLSATALPWTGGTYRGRATGMPGNALVFAITGFTPRSLPIASVLPQGLPGCLLLVSPDALDLRPISGGVATTQLDIPATGALAAQVLSQQIAAFEFDLGANLVAVTSTNAFTLTIGVL